MSITIRKSIPNDVYGIREVQRTTWLNTYPNFEEGISLKDIESNFENDKTPEGKIQIESRKKYYEDKNVCTWVVEDENKIIGFCGATKKEDFNRVGAVYVLPDYQDQGLGKLLIQKALNWLGNDKNILINVANYNTKAINFYKSFGFIESKKIINPTDFHKLPSGKIIPEIELIKVLL